MAGVFIWGDWGIWLAKQQRGKDPRLRHSGMTLEKQTAT